MIPGVEGIHTWQNGLVLNDRSDGPPFYRVRRVNGLASSGDFDPEVDPAFGRPGEVPRIGDRGGRTLSYEGEVVASDLVEMRQMIGDLVAAFSVVDEQRMDVVKHPDYPGDLEPRFFHARPVEVSIDDEQATNPWRVSRGYERAYTITLRLSDPRVYAPGEEDIEASGIGVVEGTHTPVTPPFTLVGPSNNGITLDVENEGNAPTDAEFYLYGPCRNPVLSLVGAEPDRFLRFRDLVIDDTGHVKIDFRRRRAVRGNGDNVRHTLDPASTWWDRNVTCLDPGSSTVRYRAYDLEAPAKLRVVYNHADYS